MINFINYCQLYSIIILTGYHTNCHSDYHQDYHQDHHHVT